MAFTWVLACLSLAGTYLNIRRVRICFVVWFFTNVAWAAVNAVHGIYARAVLDSVYAFLALVGWREWGRVERRGEGDR